MLLRENCRWSTEESNSDGVERRVASISDGCSDDSVQRFINAVCNTKMLAKPSYIVMSDVVPQPQTRT